MKTQLLQNTDACIITSNANRLYYTHFDTSNGIVVLTKNKDYFLTDFRYIEEATQVLGADFIVKTYDDESLKDTLKGILKNVKTVGIEEEIFYPVYKKLIEALSGYEVKNISPVLNILRSVKTDEEIALIEFAQNVNENALDKIIRMIKAGISERDLSIELKYQLLKNGADGFAFEPIVAFNKDTSKPHAKLGNLKLEYGDVIMLDFGAKYKYYCSDMTRTFCFGKCEDNEKISAYNLVLKAQTVALDHIKADVPAAEIDSMVKEIFKANGCLEYFGHGLGHGVGLDIHELPNLKQTSEDVLTQNMVVTVEPGLYFENSFGIRTEDLVIVTKDGVRNLTKFEKKFIL